MFKIVFLWTFRETHTAGQLEVQVGSHGGVMSNNDPQKTCDSTQP